MRPRLRLSLLLVSFCCIVWTDLPDAASPLVLAIPFFGLTVLVRRGVHAVDFAALLGFIAIVSAVAAFIKKEAKVLLLATKAGLGLSAILFISSSKPIFQTALTAIPFICFLLWPTKKDRYRLP